MYFLGASAKGTSSLFAFKEMKHYSHYNFNASLMLEVMLASMVASDGGRSSEGKSV